MSLPAITSGFSNKAGVRLSSPVRSGYRYAGEALPKCDGGIQARGMGPMLWLRRCLCSGPEQGLALLERYPQTWGLIVAADGTTVVSPGLRERVAWP